jgi:hypothetical protein
MITRIISDQAGLIKGYEDKIVSGVGCSIVNILYDNTNDNASFVRRQGYDGFA